MIYIMVVRWEYPPLRRMELACLGWSFFTAFVCVDVAEVLIVS